MLEEWTIREAKTADAAALSALIAAAPMQGELSLYMDRSPAPLKFPALQGDHARMFVAERSGELKGSLTLAQTEAYVNRQAQKLFHLGDLRIAQNDRQKGGSEALLETFMQSLEAEPKAYAIAEILAGNQQALKQNARVAHRLQIKDCGWNQLSQILPFWIPRPQLGLQIRPARWLDLPQLAALYEAHYRHYQGGPVLSIPRLGWQLSRHESFGINHIWLACEGDKILAALGLWDQSSLRRLIVQRYSPRLQKLSRLLSLSRFATGMPPLPKHGESFRIMHARWPAIRPGAEAALRDLIAHALRVVLRPQGYHFLLIGFHEHDPLRAAIAGFVKLNTASHLFLYRARSDAEPDLAANLPFFVDFSLV